MLVHGNVIYHVSNVLIYLCVYATNSDIKARITSSAKERPTFLQRMMLPYFYFPIHMSQTPK